MRNSSKLGRVTYTEAEQQNWKWLEAVADKALALFKPKTEPETIACAAPLFGYQAALVKEGSTEYKARMHIVGTMISLISLATSLFRPFALC
jgi:hypothetical protein